VEIGNFKGNQHHFIKRNKKMMRSNG